MPAPGTETPRHCRTPDAIRWMPESLHTETGGPRFESPCDCRANPKHFSSAVSCSGLRLPQIANQQFGSVDLGFEAVQRARRRPRHNFAVNREQRSVARTQEFVLTLFPMVCAAKV